MERKIAKHAAFKAFFLTLFLGTFQKTHAGVNVNNGNFYITYTDFAIFTPGLPIEVSRTYNSRSSYIAGKFGVGWSSELDSYLKFENKDVVYFEGGGGNVLRFTPKNESLWENNQLGTQNVKKVIKDKVTSFQLQTNVGKSYTFNSSGQLIKIQDGNKNYIELSYEKSAFSKIKDNFNNQVIVSVEDVAGFVRVKSLKSGDRKASYEYNKNGDMITAVTMDGARYVYSYDDQHNMTKVSYSNGTSKTMEYNKVRDWITAFKDIDGSSIKYDYFTDTLDPENRFGTIVSRKDSTGKEEVARYWYEFRKRKDLSRYAYRTVSSFNDQATETLLTECCGTPITITQWSISEVSNPTKNLAWTQPVGKKSSTSFEYYADGTLKRKTLSNGSVISLAYDSSNKKITKLEKDGNKIEYSYDGRQNLASAKDHSEKLKMDFTYDVQGRITIVKETPLKGASGERSLYFKYNSDGLPVEVKERNYDGKVALIKMTYYPNGQIKEVLNSSGRTIASQGDLNVTQRIYSTFQRVLEVIQPTGVSLNAEGTI
jgi:YD repeat-containing protein